MSVKKILLLDIENIHHNDQQILTTLQHYHRVYLVYAKSSLKIGLDHLPELAALVNQDRLRLLKMPHGGANAADFGLSFIAGQLAATAKKRTEFYICSHDQAIGHIVDLLKMAGFFAKQIGESYPPQPETQIQVIEQQLTVIAPPEVTAISTQHKALLQYCRIVSKMKNHPVRLESLKNSVKSYLKLNDEPTEQFILLLQKEKIVQVNQNKVSFNQSKMNIWLQTHTS
ncbi:PIN domain-containing protein [Acinetobacter brisouii]|uniref:PIN domain-containing protein n=1 Tax=Acinetobacter brisouii TaxID=396323 RepID=UPI0012506421|nr:PIN domain-containing protein [Acinetobacter brisouii]